jgi:hypothetical protein
MAMILPAADTPQQIGALQRLITAKEADGAVNLSDAKAIVAQAKLENVQGGELSVLRQLGTNGPLTVRAKSYFVKTVDQLWPTGAPTAQLAAIYYRLDPDTGRRQLLSLLDNAKNPVPGGPKTFVVTGLGKPYLAAITTGQVMNGLVKFLDGASPADAAKIRGYLDQQLTTLVTPVSRGGLRTQGMLPATQGIALSDDTREGGIVAINQQAAVLRSLEHVAMLPGPENAALAQRARQMGSKLAGELKANLDFAYPATGRLAYSFTMRNGAPATVQLEDGHHLQTTIQALQSLQIYNPRFDTALQRLKTRLPDVFVAGTEDLNGASGHIFTDGFNSFRAASQGAEADGVVTAVELARLNTLANQDGFVSRGERALLNRAAQLKP